MRICRNHDKLPVEPPNFHETHPDFLDGSRRSPDTHEVAYLDDVVEEEKNAPDHVLDQSLGTKPNGQPGHSGGGKKSPYLEVHLTENHHSRDRPHHIAGRGLK